jgi:CRP-like cAMP-binding protein
MSSTHRGSLPDLFDVEGCLGSAAAEVTTATFRAREIIYAQGDVSDSVLYLRDGAVKLSVLSHHGREGVVSILEAGAFFGDRVLAGHCVCDETATAMTAATVLIIPKRQMIRLLHEQREFSDHFVSSVLDRSSRLEEALVDQLLSSSEERLARALLLLTQAGASGGTRPLLPAISQQTLADMVGTTRSRVNVFLRKFTKLGLIECGGGIKVKAPLSTYVTGRVERSSEGRADASRRSAGRRPTGHHGRPERTQTESAA